MSTTTVDLQDGRCQWCGRIHLNQRCPLVRAIEYYPDGVTVRRIEFLTPSDMVPRGTVGTSPPPQPVMGTGGLDAGPVNFPTGGGGRTS